MEKQTKTFLYNQDLNSPHTQLQFRLPWIMSSLFSFPETRNLCAEREKAMDSADSSQGTRGITERTRVMFIRTAPQNRKRKLVRRQNDLTRPAPAEFPRTAADLDQLMRNRRQPRLAGSAPGRVRTAGALRASSSHQAQAFKPTSNKARVSEDKLWCSDKRVFSGM